MPDGLLVTEPPPAFWLVRVRVYVDGDDERVLPWLGVYVA
jgi:hypothetical protein